MQKTRRPGDQAPPNQVIHRNDHLRTASTHVKDTAGKLYLVHDGDGGVVTQADGTPAVGLTYDAARKAKEYAVTRLKHRRAGIEEHGADAPELVAAQSAAQSLPIEIDPPNPDPQLEANRQKALAAARVKAQEAQKRADEQKRRSMRAPGWEAPPAGVSSAGKASVGQTAQRAPGWVDPSKQKAPPETAAVVGLDEIPEGEGVELDADASDLLVNTDLETDVKQETERAHTEAKKLWDGLPSDQQAMYQQLITVARDDAARAKMFENMASDEASTFETIEIAYNLLFPAGAKAS